MTGFRLSLTCLVLAAIVTAQDRGDGRVRVVGTSGTPLPGVGVGDGREEGEGKLLGKTDEKGVLLLRDVPYDGSLFLSIHDRRLPGVLAWIGKEGARGTGLSCRAARANRRRADPSGDSSRAC